MGKTKVFTSGASQLPEPRVDVTAPGRHGSTVQDELSDYEALEAASQARLERLHTRPELRALIAEVQRALDPDEAASIGADARPQQVPATVSRLPAQRIAVETAKVVLERASRPLDEVAREAGIAIEDFKALHVGSPQARTSIALRVLDQIDAIYEPDRTLGGTARLPFAPGPHDARAEVPKVVVGAGVASPPAARNITGTERLAVRPEIGSGRATSAAGTQGRPRPKEAAPALTMQAPTALPGPFWLAAIIAILVTVVILAVFR